MKIETITFVYNEEFLLPFFFRHYNFVDRFNMVYDMSSTDNTLSILKKNSKVNIINANYPGGWNSMIKQLMLHDIYDTLDPDIWVLNVDCDEFAFMGSLPDKKSPVNRIAFYNVFRQVDDWDLCSIMPVKYQRCHGFLDPNYIKPVLTLSGLDIKWVPGCHYVTKLGTEVGSIPVHCNGAHWENADLCFCIERRIKNRKMRQSKHNLRNQYGLQNHMITEQSVIDYCTAHSQDPKLW